MPGPRRTAATRISSVLVAIAASGCLDSVQSDAFIQYYRGPSDADDWISLDSVDVPDSIAPIAYGDEIFPPSATLVSEDVTIYVSYSFGTASLDGTSCEVNVASFGSNLAFGVPGYPGDDCATPEEAGFTCSTDITECVTCDDETSEVYIIAREFEAAPDLTETIGDCTFPSFSMKVEINDRRLVNARFP